uniref:Uncharacterized protein n=1 Tax=Arundo donax TaxID=35708 RepID=A0A0A9H5D7_ARUDO
MTSFYLEHEVLKSIRKENRLRWLPNRITSFLISYFPPFFYFFSLFTRLWRDTLSLLS